MFDAAVRLASANWFILIGAAAAVIIPVWLAYLLRGWRVRHPRVRTLRHKVADKFGKVEAQHLDEMIHWLPQETNGNRRRAQRRLGPPTDIRVSTELVELPTVTPPAEGLVLDRSVGGLCFAVEREFQTGAVLYLRVTRAGDDCPWVAVTVRHCRDCGEFFLIGCEFRDSLPLNIRLQFG